MLARLAVLVCLNLGQSAFAAPTPGRIGEVFQYMVALLEQAATNEPNDQTSRRYAEEIPRVIEMCHLVLPGATLTGSSTRPHTRTLDSVLAHVERAIQKGLDEDDGNDGARMQFLVHKAKLKIWKSQIYSKTPNLSALLNPLGQQSLIPEVGSLPTATPLLDRLLVPAPFGCSDDQATATFEYMASLVDVWRRTLRSEQEKGWLVRTEMVELFALIIKVRTTIYPNRMPRPSDDDLVATFSRIRMTLESDIVQRSSLKSIRQHQLETLNAWARVISDGAPDVSKLFQCFQFVVPPGSKRG